MKNIQSSLRKLILVALLAATAFITMTIFNVPLIPAASYLKYEPSGALILLCGFLLGPVAALQTAFIKSVLYLMLTGDIYGVVSDFIAMALFVVTASCLSIKPIKAIAKPYLQKIIACAIACLVTTVIMCLLNYPILYWQFGMNAQAVTASMIYVIPYNLLKTICNSVLGILLLRTLKHQIDAFMNK